MNTETIARRLGAAQACGGWWRCRCPVHQSSGPTLALREGSRGLIAHCHAGCSRKDVLAELRRLGLLDGAGSAGPPDPAELQREREAERRQRAKRIADALYFWRQELVDPGRNVVKRYWAIRGVGDLPIPPTIRASRTWLRHPEGGSRPAMIALVEHVAHGPVAIHRTWLQTDGVAKAAFRDPRRSLRPGPWRRSPPGGGARGCASSRCRGDRKCCVGNACYRDGPSTFIEGGVIRAAATFGHPDRTRLFPRRPAGDCVCATAMAGAHHPCGRRDPDPQ